MISSYPKVYNLGHPSIADLFAGPVTVEEKVDGSQFSFGVFNGELKFRSKGAEVFADSPGMFAKGVGAITEIRDRLRPNTIYRGEYLQKPKHNALCYGRVPYRHVILFDVDNGQEAYLSRQAKVEAAMEIGLEIVPVFELDVHSPEDIRALIDRPSVLGGAKMEGLVFKTNERFGRDGKPLFGKYVSEAFREVHKGEWRKDNPTPGDIVDILIAKYRTPARWQKALQHLKERGELTDSPKDIGALMKETQIDIQAECMDEIKEELWQWAKRRFLAKCASGIPEWYKSQLLEKQFGGPQ